MINGEPSCCSKLSKCTELREKDGGIYTEHMVISLSRVTETAVACIVLQRYSGFVDILYLQ